MSSGRAPWLWEQSLLLPSVLRPLGLSLSAFAARGVLGAALVPDLLVGRIAAHHAVRIARGDSRPSERPACLARRWQVKLASVWLRRLRRRGPLLQVLPDLQGVHEEHRRQIHLVCPRPPRPRPSRRPRRRRRAARRPGRTTTSACTTRRSSRDGTRSRRTAPPRARELGGLVTTLARLIKAGRPVSPDWHRVIRRSRRAGARKRGL